VRPWAAASAAARETCDVEGLAPLCAKVRREAQQTLPARIRQRTADLRMRRLWAGAYTRPLLSST
jgi:hypothetical protein